MQTQSNRSDGDVHAGEQGTHSANETFNLNALLQPPVHTGQNRLPRVANDLFNRFSGHRSSAFSMIRSPYHPP